MPVLLLFLFCFFVFNALIFIICLHYPTPTCAGYMTAKAAFCLSTFQFCCTALIQFCCTLTVLFLFTAQIECPSIFHSYLIPYTPLVFSKRKEYSYRPVCNGWAVWAMCRPVSAVLRQYNFVRWYKPRVDKCCLATSAPWRQHHRVVVDAP